MKSIESIDKTAKSIGAFDSINYGVYYKGAGWHNTTFVTTTPDTSSSALSSSSWEDDIEFLNRINAHNTLPATTEVHSLGAEFDVSVSFVSICKKSSHCHKQMCQTFYKRKLDVYHVTGHCSLTSQRYGVLWPETLAGRTGNDIASSVV